MSEIVPGLFVSDFVEEGVVYQFRRGFIYGVPGGAIAISPTTWERLSPAQREEVRDILVRRNAHEGQLALEQFLVSNPGGQCG